MAKTTDVAIVGGGVIGCSIAYHLSKQGIESTVFEQGRLAGGASGATAGIIGPLWYVDRSVDAYLDLGLRSFQMFPGLAVELRDEGIDPEFRQCGILKVAMTPEEATSLQGELAWQSELGHGVTWLGREDVRDREPELSPDVLGGVFSPEEGCITGQRYVDALAHAASRRGAVFLEGTEVIGLHTNGRRVDGVRTRSETYHASRVVLATGPWSGTEDHWLPEKIPVRPVKGQRILLRKARFLPRSIVTTFPGSVIPQLDGSVLVAATREEGEFDERITADAISQMYATAVGIFPFLRDAEFVGARAGVRPGSPDGIPIMGPMPDWEGLSVASGHDHAGVMLSPATGELMANYISTGDAGPLDPFSIARFRSGGRNIAETG